MKSILLFAPFLPLMAFSAVQEENHKPRIDHVIAVRLDENIQVDGRLEEMVWRNAPAVSEFRQLEPNEGAEPTERTRVFLAYDKQALYVGARMYDSAPDSVVAQLSRRDVEVSADMFVLFIDPYHDKRSGFYFGVNAGGTRYDGTLSNDEERDESWDGVWQGRATRDDSGWCAELRIPFSQLRFKNSGDLLWGVNLLRLIQRKNEEIYLVYTPKNSSGFVSRFIDLEGIKDIQTPRHFELLPYLRGKAEFDRSQKDNPFFRGNRTTPAVGLDVKYGLGPNLTLDATFNPDFGQVEVDPAVVNLSDFETFYEEKRPFFIEGSSIFSFGNGGARSSWGFNWGNPQFFYSRRIGRAPQGASPDNDYSSIPEASTILAAGKLTGKIAGNCNVGGLVASTARESGSFSLNGDEFKQEVEPRTTYAVFRGLKEINDGRHGIGFMSTLTSRNLKNPAVANDFNKSAYSLGMDGWTFLDKEKMWVVSSYFGGTTVRGTRERISCLQHSSMHYFQRPDAQHVKPDSTASSLSGYSGRILINKQKGNVIFNSAFGVVSPGFNVNDLGFMFRTDVINYHVAFGYKWTKPSRLAREIWLIGARFQSYDYGKNKTGDGYFGIGVFTFHNYHNLEVRAFHTPERMDNRATRGGPLAAAPKGTMVEGAYTTDSRKLFVLSMGGSFYSSPVVTDVYSSLNLNLEWKPRPNLNISIGPEYMKDDEFSQYVTQVQDETAVQTFGSRYIFSRLHQQQLSANIRVNWTFTPKLSLQLYMQPLISHGAYVDFKELARPKTLDYHIYSADEITFNGDDYRVTPNSKNPANTFSFSNPDFHFKSLRGNAVLRWEYTAGSTLYFVWTQERSNYDYYNDFSLGSSMNRLLTEPAKNIFMVKFTYWWNG